MKTKLIVIEDKILIKYAATIESKTRGGIIIPDKEDREIICGYVKERGEGTPHYDFDSDSAGVPGTKKSKIFYIPLKVSIGDMVYFFSSRAADLMVDGERFFITEQKNILLIVQQDMMEGV